MRVRPPLPDRDDRTEPRSSYVSAVARHPANIALVIILMLAALGAGSIGFALFVLLAEGAAVAALPLLPAYRRHVDLVRLRSEREAAARTRAELLDRMHGDDRCELERLERVVGDIEDHIRGRYGDDASRALEACFGLRRLCATFVDLGIARRMARERLAALRREALLEEIRTLRETASATTALGELASRRLRIAELRLARLDRTREQLDAVGHQLASISALVQLVYERAMAPAENVEAVRAIDRLLGDLERGQRALDELDDLPSIEVGTSARLLELGAQPAVG